MIASICAFFILVGMCFICIWCADILNSIHEDIAVLDNRVKILIRIVLYIFISLIILFLFGLSVINFVNTINV